MTNLYLFIYTNIYSEFCISKVHSGDEYDMHSYSVQLMTCCSIWLNSDILQLTDKEVRSKFKNMWKKLIYTFHFETSPSELRPITDLLKLYASQNEQIVGRSHPLAHTPYLHTFLTLVTQYTALKHQIQWFNKCTYFKTTNIQWGHPRMKMKCSERMKLTTHMFLVIRYENAWNKCLQLINP
jgi:hypothetical protein